MAILSTIYKTWVRLKTDTGYITLKPKTDADCVYYKKSNGTLTDIQSEVTALNSNLADKSIVLDQIVIDIKNSQSIYITLDGGYDVIGVYNSNATEDTTSTYAHGYTIVSGYRINNTRTILVVTFDRVYNQAIQLTLVKIRHV